MSKLSTSTTTATTLTVATLDRGTFKVISPNGEPKQQHRAAPPYTMNSTQLGVFKTRGARDHCIIVQPPGSGKSLLVCFINTWDLSKNKSQKVIVSLPQNLIAKGFKDVLLRFPNGETLLWEVGNNFCNIGEQKIDGLTQFIQQVKFPSAKVYNSIKDRVALCSHAGLAQAFSNLKGLPNSRALWANTTLVIDEAHHVLNSEDGEEGLKETERNQLGELIHFLLKKPIPGNKLWMTTATFFRGDRLSILTDKEKKLFEGDGTYYLPLDTHWRDNIHHIQGYQFDFYMYGERGPMEAISRILSKGKRPTIVYCQDARQLEGDCKYENLEKLTRLFKKHWGNNIVMLDFVTEDGREARKATFIEGEDKGAPPPDVIFAVRLMDEGTDWVAAEQIIDLAPSNSLRVGYQRVGRVIRDTPGKARKVMLYNVLLSTPSKRVKKDKEELQRKCNLNLAALHMVALIESEFEFTPLKGVNDVVSSSSGGSNGGGVPLTWFQKKFPDANKQVEVLSRAAVVLTLERGEDKEEYDVVRTIEEMLINEFSLEDHIHEVAARVITIIDRSAKKNKSQMLFKGLDLGKVVDNGFAPVGGKDFLDDLWVYTSGICGVKTFGEWREVMEDRSEAAWDEMYELLVEYKEKNGHCEVKTKDKYKEKNLGMWICDLRRRKLSQYKVDLLNRIDFNWCPSNKKSLVECQAYAKDNNITTDEQWRNIPKDVKRKNKLPSKLSTAFQKEGCYSIASFFGKKERNGKECRVEDVVSFIKKHNIKSSKDWLEKHKEVKPKNLFLHPHRTIKNWPGWPSIFTSVYGKPYPSNSEGIFRLVRVFRSPSGELFETRNISALARDFKLTGVTLFQLISGKVRCHKGWTYVGEAKD